VTKLSAYQHRHNK